ncbi:MAG TPA: hypothetical protein VKG01_00905 [Thermoanaerobaculia bacterium]|nr:hypothetical protein [Thermoanaerobaculia bacterium]
MARIRIALLLFALGVTPALAAAPARLETNIGPGEALCAGDVTTMHFAADEGIEEMEVLLSLDGGQTFQLRVSREMPGGTREVTWRVPNLPTRRARLALRVRDENENEVIRFISDEFTIVPARSEPLEVLRRFHGEWRAGEALEEIRSTAPLDAPGLGGVTESLQAVRHETDLDRTTYAALDGAPPEGHPAPAEAVPVERFGAPVSDRIPLSVPRRE